ncbi:MAG: TIGR00282 family metallophosphoesterase [Calditrichaeota bacterium]|nr:MAG: TIGR00282 family metallophosphoesterase [Calditrichota bacterium]
MRILFIADIVGDDAVSLVGDLLPRIRQKYGIDFVIANAENVDKGKGITERQIRRLKEMGVDCLTSGNHIWERRKREVLVHHADYLLRPLNYPEGNLGLGSGVFASAKGPKVGVINLQGRSFMYSIDCPFRLGEKESKKLRAQTPIIFVDFHAEATAEKQALAWHLDGKVSAIVGTHTHVQTADERILPKGTAYITDAGMTGPVNSVIGMEIDKAIERFMLQTHVYYAMAKGVIRFNGVVVEVDEQTGNATGIFRLNFTKEEFSHDSDDS